MSKKLKDQKDLNNRAMENYEKHNEPHNDFNYQETNAGVKPK